ncbi:Two-component response regulator ARR3 [Acorus calamus]|uniref:Two-component response regulator ARR3 n=1 Tax=Acorus calamus TaxID=4465 RepID=A0AAV9FDW5_ACOCL|nr:Two-component response regulator ARR3 [Acorus calamus]
MEEENRVRVLVVDDCAVDRKVVERLLKNGSFEVILVNSGKKAMEVLGLHEEMSPTINDQRFDIILTDYCMPEMTGYDLLKENNSVKSVPVVIMSSENNAQRINSCQVVGAEDFILKPLQAGDIQRLRGHVRRNKQVATTTIGPAVPIMCKRPNTFLDRTRYRLLRVAASVGWIFYLGCIWWVLVLVLAL